MHSLTTMSLTFNFMYAINLKAVPTQLFVEVDQPWPEKASSIPAHRIPSTSNEHSISLREFHNHRPALYLCTPIAPASNETKQQHNVAFSHNLQNWFCHLRSRITHLFIDRSTSTFPWGLQFHLQSHKPSWKGNQCHHRFFTTSQFCVLRLLTNQPPLS